MQCEFKWMNAVLREEDSLSWEELVEEASLKSGVKEWGSDENGKSTKKMM